ncbi:prolipoprotein diacylglyceryl transferase [Porphyromonas gingivalis]|uniref:prolipoprotein diacylglyceryl transferase n=1 Tax=Porphyromonas gingivalis TaxID=837 RepID=UPI0003AD1274|nr:prolipoprotein diacylglyceryl transferase [Porphyromonas gingivalis]ERJ88975.1 prolipoprotein diacylglyceryl transferase [Porphyromonas gingivalis W4087]PDP49562.1 prolipoprotein diacylglyceryl transferase [Porphyromonas gingivalis]PDP62701.1 prolipoprotein diacylglyceryl transferase [Porphyromonas gingivalis]PDP75587.1 prolipoprotein diacylglyceryl transferase [Porphyromonas gingivalis]SJL22388.1 prolipoprotein diacylglyceryl transferase [Porphyromonas gingivalis]
MTLPAFITWDFDPVLFTLFGHPIVWYGLLFALGLIILGPWIEKKMWEHEKLDSKWFESLAVYVFVGTIVGARLGHVLFYDPAYYLANPAKIFVTWEGGLASHGGTIGIIIACWLYSHRVTRKSILWVLDRLAVPTGIVAAMIRLGNLTNSEIFGRPTTLPWGFRFICSEEYRHLVPNMDMGCHPTQIYEALCYLAVFALCMWLYWKRDAARRYSGLIVGVFLTGIFLSRFIIERIKIVQEPWELKLIESVGLNMGQLLSIPFVLAGIWLIIRAVKNPITQKLS